MSDLTYERIKVTITLSPALYSELVEAATNCSSDEDAVTPEEFATEAVEVQLASRRLDRKLKTECNDLLLARVQEVTASVTQ